MNRMFLSRPVGIVSICLVGGTGIGHLAYGQNTQRIRHADSYDAYWIDSTNDDNNPYRYTRRTDVRVLNDDGEEASFVPAPGYEWD